MKNVKVVPKRLADGTVRQYRYWKPNGRRIEGEPGTPEFEANLEAVRKLPPVSQKSKTYSETVYERRLDDFADRAVMFVKYKPKARRLGCDLTREYVRRLIREQGGVCAVTGLPFDMTAGRRPGQAKMAPFRPSIDRIDSNLGYVQGNVRIVCFAVNAALGQWGDEIFLKIAEAAVRTAFRRKVLGDGKAA